VVQEMPTIITKSPGSYLNIQVRVKWQLVMDSEVSTQQFQDKQVTIRTFKIHGGGDCSVSAGPVTCTHMYRSLIAAFQTGVFLKSFKSLCCSGRPSFSFTVKPLVPQDLWTAGGKKHNRKCLFASGWSEILSPANTKEKKEHNVIFLFILMPRFLWRLVLHLWR